MKWSLITACNNEAVLKSSLLASPAIVSATEFKPMRGYRSAAGAYNAALGQAATDVLVFAHQDVFFPAGWDAQLAQAIKQLEDAGQNWAVLGVMGITLEDKPKGHLYCTGLKRVIGKAFPQPAECSTLDEVVLVVRRSSNIRFDEGLPGFHLYGTDICQTARAAGFGTYIISAFCVHNTSGLTFLPWDFWRGYFYLRTKWRNRLPIRTPCTTISKVPLPVLDHPVRSAYARYVKGIKSGTRLADPAALYRTLSPGA